MSPSARRRPLWAVLDEDDGDDDAPDLALVGPTDNRIHEVRTTRFPFNTICHLGRDFGDGRWRSCSGVLIGPREVLTAGHCLYSSRLGRAPVRIRVAPGRSDRDGLPYGEQISREYYVPERFVRPEAAHDRRLFDYGLIRLPRPFPGILRFLPLRALSSEALGLLRARHPVTVAGYPADRPIGTLWHHSERLARITPRRLFYAADTCPGHSGSPVYLIGAGAGQDGIVGVHTSGIVDELGRSYGCGKGVVLAPPGLFNSGVRITPEVMRNLRDPERRAAGRRPMRRLP